MLVMGRTLVPSLLIAAVTATAGAQQKACDIDESTPAQLTRAVLNIQIAQSATKPEDAAVKLRDAVKLLNEGDLKKNPVGRAYEFGRVLVFWSAQPSMASGTTTRGALGFVTEPTAPFDIIAGIDSAFSIVEASNPECVTQTAPWRQQKGWVDLVNRAIEANNADKMDSAVFYAKRSIQLSRTSPYGYMVLAQAAQKAEKPAEAIPLYKQSIAAAKDTSMADTRRQLLLTMASYAADLAENGAAANKATYAAEAKAAFQALAADPGTKYTDAARTGLARLATLSGDTTAIKATYADQLANPSAFSYNSLMGAAVVAAKANQNKDAIKLFDAARAVNPYHRDALYNLSRLYILDSAFATGLPIARQLIAVDPTNPDNYLLVASAYATIQKGYTTKQRMYDSTNKALGKRANAPGAKASVLKAIIDSVPKIDKLSKAYSDSSKIALDSALKYKMAMDSLPARVFFNEFTPTDAKTTIGGSIQNQTEAAKTFTLKIDFLDKAGNVVTTQTVNVGPVEPRRSASFKAEGVGAGIVAFKYAPLR